MPEFTVFLRFGLDEDGKKVVDASLKERMDPLTRTAGYNRKKSINTVRMRLKVDIPKEAFIPPDIFAAIKIPVNKVEPCIEIIDPLNLVGTQEANR